jgi:Tol biopolymer transport system component
MRYPRSVAFVAMLALAGLAAPAEAAPLRITFAGESTPGNLDLFTVTPAGEGRNKITSGPADDTLPAFSPARDQIVFTRVATNGVRRLFMVHPTGGGLHVIPHTLHAEAPSWSPDGARIAFDSTDGGIYTVTPTGGGRTQLTDGAGDATPDWSPDSSRIVFARHGQIWRMRADGSHLKRLAKHGKQPAWAPNGEHIAFVRKGSGQGLAVFVMDADGSHVKQLAATGQRPAWEPNGRHIVYATGAGGASKIRTLLFAGTKPNDTFVTPGVTPAW